MIWARIELPEKTFTTPKGTPARVPFRIGGWPEWRRSLRQNSNPGRNTRNLQGRGERRGPKASPQWSKHRESIPSTGLLHQTHQDRSDSPLRSLDLEERRSRF